LPLKDLRTDLTDLGYSGDELDKNWPDILPYKGRCGVPVPRK
jgi:hypothetical protein